MHSWINKTADREERSSFSLPNRCYKDYQTEGLENGVVNILQQEEEVRALQRALNLPQSKAYSASLTQPNRPSLYNSAVLASSTCQTKVVTETDLNKNTESLFMYGISDPNNSTLRHMDKYCNASHTRDPGPEAAQFSYPSSTNIIHDSGGVSRWQSENSYAFPGTEDLFFETSKMYKSHVTDPTRTREEFHGPRKSPLEESREYFLERMMEAHKIIQHQNEAIAKTEKEISDLQKKLKNLEMDQDVNLHEIKNLKLERQNLDKIKSEGAKKKEILTTRINQLDQDFKELSVSHNALLVECKKREGDFLQSNLKLNALEAYNNNLQQVNTRMQRECDMAKQQVNEIMSENKRLQTETQQAKGETASALQEKQRLNIEVVALQDASSETIQKILQEKKSKEKLKQEIEKLKMEYSIKCNRICLLEEEVKQQQETFVVLQNELEQSFQREARRTTLDNSVLNLSLRQRIQGSQMTDCNSNLDVVSNKIENLKNQLAENEEECNSLHEQLDTANSENARLLAKNKNSKEKLDYSKQIKAQLEKDLQHLTNDNEDLYAQIRQLQQYEQQSHQVKYLQEELEKIKEKLIGLEGEKCELMSGLQEFQQDKNAWEKEKGEMIMSLAELEAENNELRQQLKDDSAKVCCESVTGDVQAIKQELDSVHKMLRLKDDELEAQNNNLQEKQTQLNKLTEEAAELRKNYADISSKTSSRNLVISSLGDQIEDRNNKIVQFENDLSAKSQQFEELSSRHTKLETELSQSSSEALQWITSDRKRLEEQRDTMRAQVLDLQCRLGREEQQSEDVNLPIHQGLSLNSEEELTTLRQENARLITRLESLVKERDSVLQDSEDLMEGMQQLKEAFEDEIERRLEKERENFVTQQESATEEHKQCITKKRELQEKHDVLLEASKSLDLKCKNVEFERDELRRQVHELCESRARSDEKATQTDVTQPSPRRKEHKGRRRSKSVGVIVPIDPLDGEEESNSSPDCSPTSGSSRRHKSPS